MPVLIEDPSSYVGAVLPMPRGFLFVPYARWKSEHLFSIATRCKTRADAEAAADECRRDRTMFDGLWKRWAAEYGLSVEDCKHAVRFGFLR